MRLIPFEFNNQQTYILEFGNLYIRVWEKDSNIPVDVTGTIPYTNEDIENIDYIQKGDVVFLVDGKHSPKQLERYLDGDTVKWRLVEYEYTNGPFKEQDDSITGYFDKSGSTYRIRSTTYNFSLYDIGKIFNIETYFKAQTIYKTSTDFPNLNTDYTSDTVLVGSSWSFTTSGTWAGTVTIQVSNDNSSWRDYKVMSSTVVDVSGEYKGSYNADITGDFDDILFVRIKVNLSHNEYFQYTFQSIGFYENIAFKVTNVNISGGNNYGLISLEEFEDSIVEYSSNYNEPTKAEPLQASAWEEGAYPKHITFYQDRLVFANTKNYPFTIWATETSNYYSFKIHSELVDSDSIQTNVVGDGLNEITAIVSLMSLIAFTENGVFRTGIDVWNATGDFALTRQSRGGSSAIRPVTIDNSCIYVKPTKDAIKDFYYQYQIDAYAGDQLDILARDLFENKKIKQLAYQEQDKTIWVLFEDGSMAYCCYMKEQEVLGWNNFETSGKVVSIATIMSNFNDTLYLAVERENGICIEKLDKRLSSKEVKDQIFLDSAIVYTENGQYFNTITGLSHLNGQTVNILADGFVIKGMLVTNGTISLDKFVTKAIVGLPYETRVETLDINYQGNGNATFGDKRRAVSASIQFIDSCDCKVGTSNGPLDEVIFRADEPLGTPTPLKTLKKDVNLTSSHNEEEHIVIVQDKPLPFTVCAINQKVSMGVTK